jgi:hypothetical protein
MMPRHFGLPPALLLLLHDKVFASFAVKVNWKFGAVTPCMASPLPLSFPSGARTFGRRARSLFAGT